MGRYATGKREKKCDRVTNKPLNDRAWQHMKTLTMKYITQGLDWIASWFFCSQILNLAHTVCEITKAEPEVKKSN